MRSSLDAPRCPAARQASVPSPRARLHAAHPVRTAHNDLSRRDRDGSPALCGAADAAGRPRRLCCTTNLAAAMTPLSGSVPNRQRMARITSPRVISGTGRGETLQRSEEHTSELQSHHDLVCRLLLEKKKTKSATYSDQLRASMPCRPCRQRYL